jgi:superfamily I DNA/RNA helicase
LLVLAGPGTGKTRLLTHRIAGLIQRELAYPAEITAITFTRKASTEIRERVEQLLAQDVADLTIATIDALAYAILYAESKNKPVKVADEWESAKLVSRAIEQVGLDKRVWTVRRLMSDIARAKDSGQSYADILIQSKGYHDPLLAYATLAADPTNTLALTAILQSPSRGIDLDSVRKIKRGQELVTTDLLGEAMLPDVGLPVHVVETVYDLITLVSAELPSKAAELTPVSFLDHVLERTGYSQWLVETGRIRDLADHIRHVRECASGHRTLPEFVRAVEAQANPYRLAIGQVYEVYQELLSKAGQIDFNDLPIKAAEVLWHDKSIAAFHRARARFILVDEYQDTSRSQYALIKALTSPERSITCVGSPAQAVYAWRGADPEFLLRMFRQDYPDAKEIVLRDNYRSTQAILAAASSVVNGKYPDARGLVPQKHVGERVIVGRFDTETQTADYVASEVQRWHAAEPGRHWNDCAVLYRTNQQSDAIQAAFTQAQVPYSLPEGQITILERPEVKHLLAYVSLAVNPDDELALTEIVNVPPRQIGAASLQKIKHGHELVSLDLLSAAMDPECGLRDVTAAGIYDLLTLVCDDLPQKASTLAPSQFLDYVLDKTGYSQWIAQDLDYYKKAASLKWLRYRAGEFDSVAEFVRAMKTMESQQLETPRGVNLNTIHGVKGLEYAVVFMVGMEEGKLPHRQALKLHSDPEEERRLCYVGMTRAKDRLYLFGSRTERVNGHVERISPSRYLADIPTSVTRRS